MSTGASSSDPRPDPGSDPEAEAPTCRDALVDHLFRHRAGQMVATLTRIFGLENLELVDDVVQDAFVKALRIWPHHGVPSNPSAWLIQVAKNRALDVLRRQGRWRDKEAAIQRALLPAASHEGDPVAFFSAEVEDDQLRMMFACCHPSLPRDAQVALTLKTVGGFGVDEIARAFLSSSSTIAQRLVRAKRTLRGLAGELSIPGPEVLSPRLDAVLEALYLMFNEGYSASAREVLVRDDLCFEAIRLAELVARNPATSRPRVGALAALFLFQASRLPTRTGREGELVLLEEQDRARWDRESVRRGAAHLRAAAAGDSLSSYHLQAEIAACHVAAPSFEDTDWRRILNCYDSLILIDRSPVVALNRVVALGRVEGAEAALRCIDALLDEPSLSGYYLLYAIHGELLSQSGRHGEAAGQFDRAVGLAPNEPTRRFLAAKSATRP